MFSLEQSHGLELGVFRVVTFYDLQTQALCGDSGRIATGTTVLSFINSYFTFHCK